MKYKLIAVDFDGTFLTDEKNMTEENITSLKIARTKGIKIIGVTGRPLGSAENVVDLNIFDYLIVNNGAYVYDTNKRKGRIISNINKSLYQSITDLVKDKYFQIDYCSPTKYYIYKGNPPTNIKYKTSINSLADIKEDIVIMSIFTNNDVDINKLRDIINNNYSDINCFVMQDSNSIKKWLVINPYKLNKKTSLESLGKSLNINLDEMIFFGDGLNDLEVISSVGLGVAMGNALTEIKDNSKDITLSNNDSGIAYYLQKNIF